MSTSTTSGSTSAMTSEGGFAVSGVAYDAKPVGLVEDAAGSGAKQFMIVHHHDAAGSGDVDRIGRIHC